MNLETGQIIDHREIARRFGGEPPPKNWTQFGAGDVVSLHNLDGKPIGWFRVSLIAGKRVSLKPISAAEVEEKP